MLAFGVEPLALIWDEKVRCAQDHWGQTSMCRNGETLNLSYERYARYEAAGWYFEIVARDERGAVAGFCGMYLVPSMHTQETLATEDFIYLKPEYRKGRNGTRFYEFVEGEMTRLGATKITLTAPPGSVSCRILERLGCEVSAIQYSKGLTKNTLAP
jgi:GNAT superfamily N-acetyltransferase